MYMKRNKRLLAILLAVILCVTMLTACGGSKLDGTYRIDGGQIIITYTLFGQEYTWEQSFSQSGNVINIGGTEFKK